MLGKNHVKVGCAATVAGISFIGSNLDSSVFGSICREIIYHGFPNRLEYRARSMSTSSFVFWCIGIVLFVLLGSYLPDIDSPTSKIGRRVPIHLFIKHRTWFHTIWPCVLITILSFYHPILWWLAVGYFLHLLVDSVSASGLQWINPINGYIYYPSGAFVAKGHKVKIYPKRCSEDLFAKILVIICVLITVYFGFNEYGLSNVASLICYSTV